MASTQLLKLNSYSQGERLPPPLRFFPCRPKTKKRNDLSHLGNLKYTHGGHFDKNIGGTVVFARTRFCAIDPQISTEGSRGRRRRKTSAEDVSLSPKAERFCNE